MELQGKNILVLGLGETGLSLARYLARHGARVRVADSRQVPPQLAALRAAVPQAEVATGAFRTATFTGIDMIAISPGVPLAEPLVQEALRRGVPVVGDVELFARELQRLHAGSAAPKVFAITGSNGKTTVTSMVGAMCRRAGLRTEVAGNISPAVLDALLRCEDEGALPQAWSLELSSFQLETTASLNPAAAVVLNLSEDHFDRYAGMDDYVAAKARIFQGEGVQVLNRDDARVMALALPGRSQVSFGLDAPARTGDWGLLRDGQAVWLALGQKRLLRADELQVHGLHNVANALAALALCRAAGLPLAPLLAALREFKGLPHRVELVAQVNGVSFYDDSKGTNVGATVAALNGMAQKVVLIAGGDGKGQDFSPLKPAVAEHARSVVLIGRDREKIACAIHGCGVPIQRAENMDEAVEICFRAAQAGDAVMLSPACASFDMFRNYEHRAQAFVAAVKRLEGA
ncbi:MAG: UDP-N-acetylmuramoyl-L-alanine--D-glutamate ligase [Pseudomonadota bacterium]